MSASPSKKKPHSEETQLPVTVRIDVARFERIAEIARFAGMDTVAFVTAMVNEAIDSHSWKYDGDRRRYIFVNFIASIHPQKKAGRR